MGKVYYGFGFKMPVSWELKLKALVINEHYESVAALIRAAIQDKLYYAHDIKIKDDMKPKQYSPKLSRIMPVLD